MSSFWNNVSQIIPPAYLLEVETLTDEIAEHICNIYYDGDCTSIDEAAEIFFNWNVQIYQKINDLDAMEMLEQKIRKLIRR